MNLILNRKQEIFSKKIKGVPDKSITNKSKNLILNRKQEIIFFKEDKKVLDYF
jgi:hypothetical protein